MDKLVNLRIIGCIISGNFMKYIILILLSVALVTDASSQKIEIFDIDDSQFPIMKAKFFAFDSTGAQVTDLSPEDFNIREDGQDRNIISVHCDTKVVLEPVSTVLVMDASGSMRRRNILLAQAAAAAWISAMPEGESECAITAFDNINYLIQDFTNIKPLLLEKVRELFANGGTDYNAAFIDEMYGALLVSKNAQHKKVIVIMTDGRPTNEVLEDVITDEAKEQNAVVFAVTLGMPCPDVLKRITELTGGQWFEDVSTPKEASDIYNQILKIVQGAEACEIVWESDISCNTGERVADVDFYPFNTHKFISYELPQTAVSGVSATPNSVFFRNILPGVSKDTTLTITASSGDMIVSEIVWDNPAFEVIPTSFSLKKGESQKVIVRYTAQSGGKYVWARMDVFNNLCPLQFFVSGGFEGKRPEESTLEILHPNGSEVFVAGNDTVVAWEGIPETDKVKLEYSIDNGMSWNLVADEASGGQYKWERIPTTPSDRCLMKVTQISDEDDKQTEWIKEFGSGFYYEYPEKHTDISMDIYGNMYVVSQYNGNINIGEFSLIAEGEEDILIAKISPNKGIEWVTSIGGPERDIATGIITDLFGNSYITGSFSHSMLFDNRGIFAKGGTDGFIAKILPDGSVEWLVNVGGDGNDVVNDICLDSFSNLIITGYYTSQGFFDKIELNSEGNSDMFLARYTPEGQCLWAKSGGGEFFDEGMAVTCDNENRIYTTGKFTKKAIIGGKELISNSDNTEFLDYEIYVAKYFLNGMPDWVLQAGGEGDDEAQGIAADENGNVFITGSFTRNSKFGNSELQANVTGDFESKDIFVARINSNGTFYWAVRSGGLNMDEALDIAVDQDGNPVIVGRFINSAKFGDFELQGRGFYDAFVARYNPDGTVISVLDGGGPYEDAGRALALDSWGNAYVVGTYILVGYFNGETILSHDSQMDLFIWAAGGGADGLQSDVSNSNWSIVVPTGASKDIDMGSAFIGTARDSLILDYVINSGDYDFDVDSLVIVGDDKDAFFVVSPSIALTVESKSNMDAEFRFSPSRVGLHTAEVKIYTQFNVINHTIQGVGKIPSLQLLTRNVDFGKVLVGTDKDLSKIPALRNTSDESILITGTRHNKPNDKDFVTLSGGGEFEIKSGDTAFIDLRFSPSIKGRTSGTLEFYFEGSDDPVIINLGGEGVNPNPSIMVFDNQFGDLFCEKETSTVIQLSNMGGDTLVINNIEFIGADASAFSVDTEYPIIIAPDRASPLTVNFSSNHLGINSSEMLIYSNSQPDSITSVPLMIRINGSGPEIDKEFIDFGIININNDADAKFTITNSGNYSSRFIIEGNDKFTLSAYDFILLEKQSKEIEVFFEGTDVESDYTESIVIRDTLCEFSRTVDLKLSVRKLDNPMISTSLEDFEILRCNNEDVKNLRISNIGNETLQIVGSRIEGLDSDDFEINIDNSFQIESGNFVDAEILFKPESPGFKNAVLIIESNSEFNSQLEIVLYGEYFPNMFQLDKENINLGNLSLNEPADFEFSIKNDGYEKAEYQISHDSNILLSQSSLILGSGEEATINGRLTLNEPIENYEGIINVLESECNISKDILINASSSVDLNLSLGIFEHEAYIGDVVTIPIVITDHNFSDMNEIGNISFEIVYNSTLLLPLGDYEFTSAGGTGILKIDNIKIGEREDSSLMEISFMTGLGNSETSDLIIENVTLKDNRVNISTQNGSFKSLGVCYEGGTRLFNPNGQYAGITAISPNPSDREASISVRLIEKGLTKLSLYNTYGKLLKEFDINYQVGDFDIKLDNADFESGVYYIHLNTPTINQVRKFLIVK